jgi:CO dehydrogenase/acetyl-CoA synthase delta subunit
MGQRDIMWTRVSKTGFASGLRLKHYGEIIHAKLLADYPAIVDKVKVTLITDLKEVEQRIAIARKTYDDRNRRIETMTDESVDTFYSCLLCQSFAPNHVCIITPERLGLCGAYNWLDGKAAFEIDETGPNQPVRKGNCIDPVKGIWEGIDNYVNINSHKSISSFCAYSIMDRPMTSCGCFEAICAYVPELNGVMVVNREHNGETPVGMTFSTLAGNVGGGQQTPGFMGVGKVFLTSKKFLYAEGGFKRLVWMTKELKELLKEDLEKRFEEQGVHDLFDKIADETVSVEVKGIRDFMEKVGHPALTMEDMSVYSDKEDEKDEKEVKVQQAETSKPGEMPPSDHIDKEMKLSPELINQIKEQVTGELKKDLKASVTREVVGEIIGTLSKKFLGEEVVNTEKTEPAVPSQVKEPQEMVEDVPPAAQPEMKVQEIKSFKIPEESSEIPVWQAKLGATKKEGGTRGRTCIVGGATCMPFHLWEGEMPHPPLVAMEVFDLVNEKYPQTLKEIYGDLLHEPDKMAAVCVEKYGADLISVRLEGTHPEKGDRSPKQAVELVKSVLQTVDVPLIITGHSNYERINDIMRAVARECAGENLLLNWVEQDNYRTIAGVALGYGHSIVAQSPIDVNIAKQLNILLTNMDVKKEQIVMDPMTGAAGYGIEYTYSVMERIRLTGLHGDKMLAGPMIVSPGQECHKIKEFKAPESDFPEWGNLSRRSAAWELVSGVNLLYAGADILIMYHPEAAMATKKTITRLLERKIKK